MATINRKTERLSIDVLFEEHKKIKTHAALRGITIREYVLDTVRERLAQEEAEREAHAMTGNIGSLLRCLWDNEKDSSYDAI